MRIKQSILWLSAIAILFCMSLYIPNAAFVSSQTSDKLLPIYCVETDKKQISLSFDAAWGNIILC